jgi:hypothetical protein
MSQPKDPREVNVAIQRALENQSLQCSEMFKAILVVIDMSLQIEMSKVMSASTTGEARVHSAGRLDALNDILVELQSRRDVAVSGTNATQSNSPNA